MMRSKVVAAAVLTAATLPSLAAAQWKESAHPHFSVFYQAGFEKDADSITAWAESAERVMLQKYGVTPARYRLSIYLHPAPNARADVNTAHIHCCTGGADSIETGTIDLLAPSAPAMRSSTAISSLGIAKSRSDYSAKILVSEYIPIGHYAAQASRPGGGWKYYSAPNWFVQGLQEYDAIFHSTAWNRDTTSRRLLAWAKENRRVFTCCSPTISIADDYNGGAAFMMFLAVQFGEGIHARLLRSSAPTFFEALGTETRDSPEHLFALFQDWLAR